MMVRYWHPFEELETLRRQLDHAFDDAAGQVKTTFTPAASLVEADDAYTLRMALPGVDINAVDIQASRRAVAISGERQAPEYGEGQRLLHNDFSYGTFRRVVNLPAGIDHENVEASYADGILTLRLPKSSEHRNRVVKVAINGAAQPAIAADDSHTETEASNA